MAHAESILREPLTDWDEVYFRIRASSLGCDMDSSTFIRTPIGYINKISKYIDDEEQREANIRSVTTAQLAVLLINVAHGFSGKRGNTPKVKATDFLPFPEWKPTNSNSASQIDPITKQILTQLIRRRAIPMYVFVSLLSSDPEDG